MQKPKLFMASISPYRQLCDILRCHKVLSPTVLISRRSASDLTKRYGDTLNLPSTQFPNHSGSKEEIDLLIQRTSKDLYQWQTENLSSKNSITFHDGPPYANGSLHLGHALNKILKDIINRYNLMQGKQIKYVPGWDCHGMPIEHKALATISEKMKLADAATSLSTQEIRSIARSHAQEAVEIQKSSFQSWAIMGDWQNAYKTFDLPYEIRQLKVFRQMLQRGFITRQNKPVYWGTETRTALAEAELEYNDKHKSTAAYVRFPIRSANKELIDELQRVSSPDVDILSQLNALIWTTTPWTLVANKAIAIHPQLKYGLVYSPAFGYLIVSESRLQVILELDETFVKVEGFSVPGTVLVGLKYSNFLLDKEQDFPIVAADFVTETTGTGLVHCAPGHGMEDYLMAKSHGIDAYSPVDSEGRYYGPDLPEHLQQDLSGKAVIGGGQKTVLKLLEDFDALIDVNTNYRHKYPYDWRSKKPVIIRSTPQWFADVGPVKQDAIEALKQVQFYPETGRTRLTSFTLSRNEWCISRQRVWGVPIPALYHIDSGEALLTVHTVDHIISRLEKIGTDAWFLEEDDIEDWLPEEYRGQGKLYRKGKETMDVWFDSGTSWTMLEDRGDQPLADFYLEGTDQHRGWFQSSLLTKISVADHAVAPFKTVITHGFTLDEKGQKMSKSLGNTIAPEEVVGNGAPNNVKEPKGKGKGKSNLKGNSLAIGVDGLRVWVASSDFTGDVTVGPTVMKNVAESLRKLRITLRFLLGNLNDVSEPMVPYESLRFVDKIALHQLYVLETTVNEYYRSFQFNRVMQAINNHVNTDLSSFYFDVVKDRLYADNSKGQSRKAVQYVLSKILQTYLGLLSPIAPLLTQQAWDYAPEFITQGVDSPFKKGFVPADSIWLKSKLAEEYELLKGVISGVKSAMEQGRKDK